MVNKAKISSQAQKFVAKGQWDKALRELQKLVDDDPSDVRTLLKIGDVHSKKGDRENATRVYKQVAETYSEQGFFLKAVAVYKQILKHDPTHLEVTLRLAELYEQLGLSSEAMAQYQIAARIHDEQGDAKASLEILRRMVELDSDNVASRIKLAESFSRDGQVEDAAQEFEKAASILKSQRRMEDYVKVVERLIFHAPDRTDMLKELAKLYLDRGDAIRGVAKLQSCFKKTPGDIETLELLGRAFRELGKTDKMLFVYRSLAAAYETHDRIDDAAKVHNEILALAPEDAESQAWLDQHGGASAAATAAPPPSANIVEKNATTERPLVAPSLAPRPSLSPRPQAPSAAPRPSAQRPPSPEAAAPKLDAPPTPAAPSTPSAPAGSRDQIQKILTEAEVYLKYGLHQKSLDHIAQVFAIEPEHVEALRKQREIYGQIGNEDEVVALTARLAQALEHSGDTEAHAAELAELKTRAPMHPLLSGEPASAPQPVTPPARAAEDLISIDIEDPSIELEEVFDVDEAALDASSEDVSGREDAATPMPLEPADADFDIALGSADLVAPESDVPPPVETASEQVLAPAEPEPPAAPEPPAPMLEAAPTAEPESIAALDIEDLAPEDVAATAAPAAPEAAASAQTTASAPTAEPAAPAISETEAAAPAQAGASAPGAVPSPDEAEGAAEISDELEEAEFLVDNSLWDEAREALAQLSARAPNHPRVQALLALVPPPDASDASPPEPATSEADGVFATADLPDEEDLFAGLGDFDADAADPLTGEDHYDQGMALREIGRIEQAIEAFRLGVGRPERGLDCLEMLGHCSLELGRVDAAIDHFKRALEGNPQSPGAPNLMFEIGLAYESAGDLSAARSWIERCRKDDPGHPLAEEALARLQDAAPAAPDNASDNPKVSYL